MNSVMTTNRSERSQGENKQKGLAKELGHEEKAIKEHIFRPNTQELDTHQQHIEI